MDAKHALLNPYLVTSASEQSPSAQSKDYTDYFREIHPGGPLNFKAEPGMFFSNQCTHTMPCAKYQRTVVRRPNTTDSNMYLYNGEFTKLLVQNASTDMLDHLFSRLVRRFGYATRAARDNTYWAPARRSRQLIKLRANDRNRCVESITGPGLSLSNWPPDKPFLHNAARLGCAAIVAGSLSLFHQCSAERRPGDRLVYSSILRTFRCGGNYPPTQSGHNNEKQVG